MTTQNPYELLGLGDNASFDEVQSARQRLQSQHSGDKKLLEEIEAAYDAVLMDRLRLRQEGKIKVPDRIRFPDREVRPPVPTPAVTPSQPPSWLQRWIDTPSRNDILIPAAVFLVLAGVAYFQPFLALSLGLFASLYFINRKENRIGRALLLSFAGLAIGTLAWGLLDTVLPNVAELGQKETMAAWVTCLIFWLITSFLR